CEGRPDPQKKEYQRRKIRDPRLGLEPPGQYSLRDRRAEPNPARESRAALASRPFVSERLERQCHVLRESERRPGKCHPGRDQPRSLCPPGGDVEIPLWKFGRSDTLMAEDLMRGRAFAWTGKYQRVRLDPELPFAIWRVS